MIHILLLIILMVLHWMEDVGVEWSLRSMKIIFLNYGWEVELVATQEHNCWGCGVFFFLQEKLELILLVYMEI